MRAAGVTDNDAHARLHNSFGDHDPVVTALGWALLDYVKLPENKSKAFLECVGMGLAVHLLERHAEKTPRVKGKLSPAQLVLINDYLNCHMNGSATLESMAGLPGMSPCHFQKLFQATVGMSPLRYSLQVRMRRARMLMEGTRRLIGDIAREVGFPDLPHFTKMFHRYWGQAPSKFRPR